MNNINNQLSNNFHTLNLLYWRLNDQLRRQLRKQVKNQLRRQLDRPLRTPVQIQLKNRL